MTRTTVQTRTACEGDVPALVEMWHELQASGGRTSRTLDPSGVIEDLEGSLRAVLADGSCRLVVAEVDGVCAGMILLSVVPLSALSRSCAVQLGTVVVSREYRRRGVGHALVAAAAAFAEERGVDHVVVGVYPASREANRFYARLGFAPLSVRRVAQVSGLRRRLAAPERRSLLDDVARRRQLARRPPRQRLHPPAPHTPEPGQPLV